MRDDFQSFKALGAEIVVVTRHDSAKMQAYWRKEALPFRGVADPRGRITERYGQQWRLLALGRMPAQILIDCQGKIALSHYGTGMSDIIPNSKVLKTMETLRERSGCPQSGR